MKFKSTIFFVLEKILGRQYTYNKTPLDDVSTRLQETNKLLNFLTPEME